MCYPAELMHAAVDDLLSQGVDFVFLPYMREFPGRAKRHARLSLPGHTRYARRDLCVLRVCRRKNPDTGNGPGAHLATVTPQEVASLGARLGVSAELQTAESWSVATAHQAAFESLTGRRLTKRSRESRSRRSSSSAVRTRHMRRK